MASCRDSSGHCCLWCPADHCEEISLSISSYVDGRTVIAARQHSFKWEEELPFSTLAEELMVSQAIKLLLHRNSSKVRTGRKWRAQEAGDQAEKPLWHSLVVGTFGVGWAGLCSIPRSQYDKPQEKERSQSDQEEIQAGVEENQSRRMVRMQQQGAWTSWGAGKILWLKLGHTKWSIRIRIASYLVRVISISPQA